MIRRFSVLVLLLATVGCASARPSLRDPYHVAAIGVAAADVTTTTIGLRQPHIEETNPAAVALCGQDMNLACMIGMKAALISLLAWVENTYELDGWSKRILWLMPIGMWGGAAIWNATVVWEP